VRTADGAGSNVGPEPEDDLTLAEFRHAYDQIHLMLGIALPDILT